MFDRLETLEERYEELGHLMSQHEVVSDMSLLQKYAREHSQLGSTVSLYRAFKQTERSIADARSLLEDEEMRDLALAELEELSMRRTEQLAELRRALIPRDPNDEKDCIVEIRAAAGGEEAALFAGELFHMYLLYAEKHNLSIQILDMNETGIGGYKEVIFEVKGDRPYARFKYESGVHRVQRVPATESGGRIHTSTATVIVMPEAEDVDLEIKPEDLRIDVYRASGHGGQGVNTTDSAVRITHLPTGIVVTCQNERSQLKNKASAMSVLRARLYDAEQDRRAREMGEARKSQVQTGDRSEKIRTYNYPQDRVTDHRINLTLHNLPSILTGNVDPFIEQLSVREEAESLELPAE